MIIGFAVCRLIVNWYYMCNAQSNNSNFTSKNRYFEMTKNPKKSHFFESYKLILMLSPKIIKSKHTYSLQSVRYRN